MKTLLSTTEKRRLGIRLRKPVFYEDGKLFTPLSGAFVRDGIAQVWCDEPPGKVRAIAERREYVL